MTTGKERGVISRKAVLGLLSLAVVVSVGGVLLLGDNSPEPAPPPPGQEQPPVSQDIRVNLKLIAEGLVSPVGLVPPRDGSGRLFIVDQAGVIKVVSAEGKVLDAPFLDLTAKIVQLNASFDERGLLGLAFHPAFKDNGRFFVYYSAPLRPEGPQGWNHTSHISGFKVSTNDPNRADPQSERILLQVDQPQANHNAGQIVFGPDGFLYIPLGDGGASNDRGLGHPPIGNGQDTSTLLGSILRIDIDSPPPYGIPRDNPFAGKDGRDEIFAFGLRNPFRISFDAGGNRELFVGDVGQRMREEVNIVTIGNNYGWNIREGNLCFDPDNPTRPPEQCPSADAAGRPLTGPVLDYANAQQPGGLGTAVIGGFVYRGSAIPSLPGVYIFGDFSSGGPSPSGLLFTATRPATPGEQWPMKELAVNTGSGRIDTLLRSFGQDESNELYILTADSSGPSGKTGKVYKIVP